MALNFTTSCYFICSTVCGQQQLSETCDAINSMISNSANPRLGTCTVNQECTQFDCKGEYVVRRVSQVVYRTDTYVTVRFIPCSMPSSVYVVAKGSANGQPYLDSYAIDDSKYDSGGKLGYVTIAFDGRAKNGKGIMFGVSNKCSKYMMYYYPLLIFLL